MKLAPLFLVLAAASCSTPKTAPVRVAPEREDFLPPLEHVVSVRDGRTGERIGLDELYERLARHDAVFLGESHIDETTHRIELAVYAALLERRKKVVLAMEMFERDVQGALDDYLAGRIDEPAFLARSRPWSNYRTAYRPMVELAKDRRASVVAANFPATLRSKVAADQGGLDALTPEERAFAPRELLPNTPFYWKRVDNAIRGHAGMMPVRAVDDQRLLDTQSLWDNAMGEACAVALDRHPGALVLHVNGGFHTEYWDGTARQLLLRKPDARIATVAIVTSSHPASAELDGLAVADYVVFAHERAQDVNEGTFAVNVARELEYRLHVPAGASGAVPLLVWLADDGENAADAMELWKARIGRESAIAVLVPPYRETQEDLVEGGRWFWPDSFREDVGPLVGAVAELRGYVSRHFPIDRARVVLAGEGTGGTIAATCALLGGELAVRAVALAPKRFRGLSDFPLPLPELRGDEPKVAKSLRVIAADADQEWWAGELAQYTRVGLENELEVLGADPWRDELARENAVRVELGLAPRAIGEAAAKRHLVVGDSARARSWGRLLAHERAAAGELLALLPEALAGGESVAVELAATASAFANGAPLPRAPGPFGGTTVVVLPDGIAEAEREAWAALQQDDPLNKTSRFHRLVLASQSGDRVLPVVLEELYGKNRKNVLVVPAQWCADGETMRALRKLARPFEDRMTLHWRPGLGGTSAPKPR